MDTTAYFQFHADRTARLRRSARNSRLRRTEAARHRSPRPAARGPAAPVVDLREPVPAGC